MSLAATTRRCERTQFRSALMAYLEWVRGWRSATQEGAEVVQQAPVPRWGLGRSSAFLPSWSIDAKLSVGPVLRAVLGPSHGTSAARLTGLGRAAALDGRWFGCGAAGCMGATEGRPGHRAVPARCPVALERRARPRRLADTRCLSDHWHDSHPCGRRAECGAPGCWRPSIQRPCRHAAQT